MIQFKINNTVLEKDISAIRIFLKKRNNTKTWHGWDWHKN